MEGRRGYGVGARRSPAAGSFKPASSARHHPSPYGHLQERGQTRVLLVRVIVTPERAEKTRKTHRHRAPSPRTVTAAKNAPSPRTVTGQCRGGRQAEDGARNPGNESSPGMTEGGQADRRRPNEKRQVRLTHRHRPALAQGGSGTAPARTGVVPGGVRPSWEKVKFSAPEDRTSLYMFQTMARKTPPSSKGRQAESEVRGEISPATIRRQG
jgi:hypothetical protein